MLVTDFSDVKKLVDSTPKFPEHKVTVELSSNGFVMNEIRKDPKKAPDYLEMCRELEIMNEVKKSPGKNIVEKIDNTIKSWNNNAKKDNKVCCSVGRYKLKYKY